MTDKSWELLTKLINACGYDISEIEDEFDFDELCEQHALKMQEYERLKKLINNNPNSTKKRN